VNTPPLEAVLAEAATILAAALLHVFIPRQA